MERERELISFFKSGLKFSSIAFQEDTFVNRFRLTRFGIVEVPLISFGLRVWYLVPNKRSS